MSCPTPAGTAPRTCCWVPLELIEKLNVLIPAPREGGPVGAGLGPGAGVGAPPAEGSVGLCWATLLKRVFDQPIDYTSYH